MEDERPQEQAFGCHARAAAVGGITVNELALAYSQFAAGYYVEGGGPTTEQRDIRLSVSPSGRCSATLSRPRSSHGSSRLSGRQ
ncbi:MAG: hypothetical protein ACYC61_17770 [Isosphaeraceae bacterium]